VTSGPVRIPAFSSRSLWRWSIATAVAVLVVGVVVVATQPENRIFVVTVLPASALLVVVLVWRTTWVDPEAGTVARVQCRVWRRELRLQPGTTVALVPNGGGSLLLAIRPQQGRRLFVSVVARTDYVEQSQPPELLRLLADTVERHHAGGARPVAEALRLQADHLAAGGTVAGSPLARLITTGVLTAAKAGGAGAVGGHLG
jgi:hypothetical protein